MKRVFFALSFLLTGFAAQAQKQAIVTGVLKLAVPGSKVYLETNNPPVIRLDSTVVGANKRFSVKTNVPEGGAIYIINLSGTTKMPVLLEGGETIEVLAEPGIKGKEKNAPPAKPKVTMSGSKTNDQFRVLYQMQTDLQTKGQDLMKSYQEAQTRNDAKSMSQIEKSFDELSQQNTGKVKAMLPELGTSLAALYATNFLSTEADFPTLDTLARRFEKENPNSTYAKSFVGNIARIRGVAVGSAAPEISLADTNGTAVPLSSLRGKFVLIDFWAS